MRFGAFRKVVNTRDYHTQAMSGYSHNLKPTLYHWENTNKLLGNMDGLIGCKTGVTTAAGPCFAGYYETKHLKLVMILCSSKSMEARWKEIRLMVDWVKSNKRKLNKETPMGSR